MARGPMLGLLSDAVSIEAAAAELDPLVRGIRGDPPDVTYDLVRELDEVVAPVRPALVLLFVAVAFVLLIACVNVANLLLARTTARQREMGIRIALGAGRGRLIRQTLTESVLLALLGGAFALALAFGGITILRDLTTTLSRADLVNSFAFPRFDEIGIDRSVLFYTMAISLLTGIAFGLAPVWRHDRSTPTGLLRTTARMASAPVGLPRSLKTQSVLVVVEIGLAMILLVGGTLLLRSVWHLASVPLGYNPEHILTFQVSLPTDRYSDAAPKRFAEDLVARLDALPGVEGSAYANQLPTVNLRDTAGGLWRTPDPNRLPSPAGADARLVSRDYLPTMGVHLLRGRGFRRDDGPSEPRILLVNAALARHDFPGEDPIGQRVFIGRDVTPWEIVGVVDNVREFGLDRSPEPQFFIDVHQWPEAALLFPIGAYYVVRTNAAPSAILPQIRSIVHELEANAALFDVAPMEQLVAATIAPSRAYAVLLGAFALVGLVLAAIGVYGVVAYGVIQRTREIGIRMALGAQRRDVLALVLRRGLVLTSVGVLSGAVGAAAVSRYLGTLLFGVTPLDPTTFVWVSVLFACVAVFASVLPARRAAAIDPQIAIRCD